MFKSIFHWIIIAISVVALLISSVVVVLTLQRDTIIGYAVQALNERLNVKVGVQKIDLTFLKTFPDVSLRLQNCTIRGNTDEEPLAFIRTLDFRFDVLPFLRGVYTIEKIVVYEGEFVLYTNAQGKHNFTDLIRKEASDTSNVSFSLENIILKNSTFTYEHAGKSYFSLQLEEGKLSMDKETKGYSINTYLLGKAKRLQIKDQIYISEQPVELEGELLYSTEERLMEFKKVLLNLNGAEMSANGTLSTSGKGKYEMQFRVPSLELSVLKPLLPLQVGLRLKTFDLEGTLDITGYIRSNDLNAAPEVAGELSLRNGQLLHPDIPERIDKLKVEAKLRNHAPYDLSTYELSIPTLSAGVGGETVLMKGILHNFKKPFLKGTITGQYPAAKLSVLLNPEEYRMLDGEVQFDISFEKSFNQSTKMSGELTATKIPICLARTSDTIFMYQSTCLFNGEDVAFSNTELGYKGQKIRLNGIIYDLTGRQKESPVKVGVFVETEELNLDSLFTKDVSGSTASVQLPKQLVVSAKLQAKTLHFQKHRHDGVSMRLYMDSSQIFVEQLKGTIGGGIVDAELHLKNINHGHFSFSILAKADKVPVDSVFYMRDNFSQQFITYKHISGFLNGTIRMYGELDQSMQPILSTLLVDADIQILNGRLYQFEPMKALAKYSDEASLQDIRFSTLSNTIHIEKGIVYIPEMIIGSNIREITVAGKHGFDQTMHYTIRIPVSKKKANDSDARFGALEEVQGGGLFLYLKVTGTPDNMQIAYDKQAVKAKIGERIQQEKREMIRLFKPASDTLRKKTSPIQLEEDSYFDFD